LIPYIGNKRRLLPLIARAVDATDAPVGSTFVDLFTGSTVVARMAKTMGLRVLANDWEPYSFEIALATVSLNSPPAFSRLGGADTAFAQLNALLPIDGYVTTHLCPKSDDDPDPQAERMFFTRANGGRIDAIRERLDEWERAGLVDDQERAFVLASLVYATSYVSNTSGVFKGFHNGWGGKTGTALYRIRSALTLRPPVLFNNGLENLARREDADSLAKHLADDLSVRPHVVYLDPPYNQHPYGSNYHVLNTVTLWDKVPMAPVTVRNGRLVDKSAIRTDWRTERRSDFNHAGRALPALKRLLRSLDARWILMSYSTDGNIPLEDVLFALADRGTLSVIAQRYKRYRVSPSRPSFRSHNTEFVAIVDGDGRPNPDEVDPLIAAILAGEAATSPGVRDEEPGLFF
jgi:adenine-specific DNA-methyltransferase